MKYSAVIFDMDGVLIDSEAGYNRADERMFARLGIPFGPEEIRAITGSSGTVIGPMIKGWHPQLKESAADLTQIYNDGLYESLRNDVSALAEGVDEWIARLKKEGYALAIASSSTAKMVYYIAERFGLDKLMDAIVTGDEVEFGKPYPEIYLKCAGALGIDPADCLAVEDSTNGVRAAQAAGMHCAAFTGTNRHAMDLSFAEYTFPEFTGEWYERVLLSRVLP